jgi:bifunctional NMN adenylyltransferase/nudix hydrolase
MILSKSPIKIAIYIGRFSMFHNGHAEVLERARSKYDMVFMLLGSINQARTPKNPWTFDERAFVIKDSLKESVLDTPVRILGIRDYPYNDSLWIANVHRVIDEELAAQNLDKADVELTITGADRDKSTFYLKLFPEFKIDLADEDLRVSRFLTATTVREIYFGKTFNNVVVPEQHSEVLLKSFLPQATINFIKKFEETPAYKELREEHISNVAYRIPYTVRKPIVDSVTGQTIDPGLPYEVQHQTVDAVVIQTGYILLVKRRARPGKGLWALPGGHLNPNERLFEGAIRELVEETCIKVPEPVLRSSFVCKEDFDDPNRSLRGRTITKAFLFKLPDFVKNGRIELPKVKGADDAEKAMWVPLNQVLESPEIFFEDHYFIIESMLGKL